MAIAPIDVNSLLIGITSKKNIDTISSSVNLSIKYLFSILILMYQMFCTSIIHLLSDVLNFSDVLPAVMNHRRFIFSWPSENGPASYSL